MDKIKKAPSEGGGAFYLSDPFDVQLNIKQNIFTRNYKYFLTNERIRGIIDTVKWK